jgi:hypothetical protein
MARRKALTRAEIAEAIEQLTEEGKDVTSTALLKVLGGGSLSTISRFLRTTKPPEQTQPSVEPETLRKRIAELESINREGSATIAQLTYELAQSKKDTDTAQQALSEITAAYYRELHNRLRCHECSQRRMKGTA